MWEFVETILAPRLQGDGGWVEWDSLNGNTLTLVFRGECSKCLILDRCVHWMEEELEKKFGQHIVIQPVRKKPFFWDT